ncbi:hypothetical protein V1504DRAFT_456025 [Lipomyces starkeyi]
MLLRSRFIVSNCDYGCSCTSVSAFQSKSRRVSCPIAALRLALFAAIAGVVVRMMIMKDSFFLPSGSLLLQPSLRGQDTRNNNMSGHRSVSARHPYLSLPRPVGGELEARIRAAIQGIGNLAAVVSSRFRISSFATTFYLATYCVANVLTEPRVVTAVLMRHAYPRSPNLLGPGSISFRLHNANRRGWGRGRSQMFPRGICLHVGRLVVIDNYIRACHLRVVSPTLQDSLWRGWDVLDY